MGKIIDKLDLKKRKEDLEREARENEAEKEPAPLQQIPIHSAPVASKPAAASVEENGDVWGRGDDHYLVRQVAVHATRERAAAPVKMKKSKTGKKTAKKGAKRSAKRTAARPARKLEQDVVIRSVRPAIEEEVYEDNGAIDLKHIGQKNRSPYAREEDIGTSFLSKINKKIGERMEKEMVGVKVAAEPETFAVEPAETAEAKVEAGFCPPPGPAFKRALLSSGLRFVTAPIPGTKTITALLMFGTGSKYESLSISGISHFLEHMFFKGTTKRSNAKKLSSELDALGCEYNAFTGKEYTGYWIKIDSSRIAPALDILSDMLLHSKFSAVEIEKEKGVIIEEINMYHENPMMHIEDVFESCLYGDTPAGREIAGLKGNVKAFKRLDFINYFMSQYGANSAVLCLAGDVNDKTAVLAEKYFGEMPKSNFKEKLRAADAQEQPRVKLHYKEGNQAIISLGVRAYDTYHQDKMILKVLSVILGGSMSSRMFTEVREKRGLAYSVRTSAEFYTDTGYLTTQAGIPVGKQTEAIRVILGEYKKIAKQLVPKEELQRAKDLIKGRTIIGFESSDNVADWYARQAVLREDMRSPEDYFKKLAQVSAADIRRVAKDIFKNEKLNLAIIGPFKDDEAFRKIAEL